MIERTLILVKPDAVRRGLIGDVIKRFEQRGLKIIGMKMVWADKEFAQKHYTEDIAKRRGEEVRRRLLDFIIAGPVVAMVLEGIDAVEVARKIVGETEPKAATPGTIRGDFSHQSFKYMDETDRAIHNLVHASGNKEEAQFEINLWFKAEEVHDYKRSDHDYVL